MRGFDHLAEPGHPALPVEFLRFVIPADARVTGVELVHENGSFVPGTFDVFPAQKPVPISGPQDTEFTEPDLTVYGQNRLYPPTVVEYVHDGSLAGFRIAAVKVTPLRYNPATKKLYLSRALTFRLTYERSMEPVQTITDKQRTLAEARVRELVVNNNDVGTWAPFTVPGLWESEYIIITDPSFASAFERLREWKMRRGVPTDIVTTDWIYAHYSGADNAEQVRNFVREAADSGAMYFLLAGQCDYEHGEEYVPRRNVYCMNSGGSPHDDTIPCDHYFSDLDGNWNNDGDGTYGEMTDGVNLYSDVYVGRAPVKDTTQINNFITKIITYETAPSSSFLKKILLPVGNLWYGNHGNGINDTVADAVPGDWQKSKLYQDYGLMSRFVVRDSISQGFHHSSMVGHGSVYGIYYNYGASVFYHQSDADVQANDSTDAVITTSIACNVGGVDLAGPSSDNDCLAERMINTNKKCATATVMNTRFGWGYTGPQNNIGLSGEYSVWFYRKLFNTSAYHIGEVLAAAKDELAPQALSQAVYRWCHYEFTLFGDPEMPIWTDATKELDVTLSSDRIAVYGDGNPDTFAVTVGYAGSPVSNALVTIMFDSTAYERLYTDGAGQAQFTFADDVFDHEGTAWVTITHYSENYLPVLESGLIVDWLNVYEEPSPEYLPLDLTIGPNPARDVLHLNFGAPVRNGVTVKLYDVQGRLVSTAAVEKGMSKAVLPTSQLSNGIYFVTTSGDIARQEKIIIVQ
ncbi:hypothetical protein AMJ87_07095 [candidate division WOR_3 bacterium SM23_60]|uniref:Gingipain domain-containing protein n=1 Tax=candidate division WOR_3 bacterium SM23_60 TaxID=1703780 RepID=A0A0S8GG04_UNCW3|nr:MAG: hypothetical protein AMJ87_07095 [candidate division WOR_3 bacterium SM23_60]